MLHLCHVVIVYTLGFVFLLLEENYHTKCKRLPQSFKTRGSLSLNQKIPACRIMLQTDYSWGFFLALELLFR